MGYILDADWQERKYTGVGGGICQEDRTTEGGGGKEQQKRRGGFRSKEAIKNISCFSEM